MNNVSMHPYVNTAISAIREASNIIFRALDRPRDIRIDTKGHNNFVTSVDKAVEQFLVDTLHEAYPMHNFITEEQGDIEFGGADDITWIIDPIDGTTNFIKGIPNFVISMAARRQGRLEHGIIYHPITQELFTASRGSGAQLNGRRIRVSGHTILDGAVISLGIPREEAQIERYIGCLRAIRGDIAAIRRSGTTALDLAYIAAGRLDGIWANEQQPWDIAAGMLLIREAGGIVTDIDGGDRCFETGNIVAANNKLIRPLLKLLREHG